MAIIVFEIAIMFFTTFRDFVGNFKTVRIVKILFYKQFTKFMYVSFFIARNNSFVIKMSSSIFTTYGSWA